MAYPGEQVEGQLGINLGFFFVRGVDRKGNEFGIIKKKELSYVLNVLEVKRVSHVSGEAEA